MLTVGNNSSGSFYVYKTGYLKDEWPGMAPGHSLLTLDTGIRNFINLLCSF